MADNATVDSLILSELQALRSDYNEHARVTEGRLASLESGMHLLCGNGRPGKIAEMETAIRRLQQWRWWVMGTAAGVGGTASVVLHLWGLH
jgi:hypothetical protein